MQVIMFSVVSHCFLSGNFEDVIVYTFVFLTSCLIEEGSLHDAGTC